MFGLFRKKSNETPAKESAEDQKPLHSEVLNRIVPVVKVVEQETSDMQHIDLPPEDSPVSKTLAADLIVMYAEDLPDHFSFLSKKRIAELGLTMDSLHELAVQNLANRIPPIELHGSPPKFMITAGGNFEATLLLHPTLWSDLAEYLPGSPMAVVPARDLLFVTSSEWEDGRQFLKEMAEKELEDKRYSLSKHVFVRRADTWVPDGLNS